MTRAADRLIVCGAAGQRQRPAGCWYDLVRGALEDVAAKAPAEICGSPILRLQGEQAIETAVMPAPVAEAITIERPDWLTRRARGEALAATVSPSTALEQSATSVSSGGAADNRLRALARGTLVHRLMQSLPDIAPERRAAASRRYLDRASGDFTAAEREAIAVQVLALLDDSRFASLAGAGSRAEVPIVGRIDRGLEPPLMVSGQVDRLAVTQGSVLIADYKTNHPAPRQLQDVPDAYVAQLALYRAMLAKLYPGRAVRALLVWTDLPDFMEISGSALDAALDRVTRR